VTAIRGRPWYALPSVRRVFQLAAVVGVVLGIETTILHLSMDPLGDVHAYYDAGSRLNAGEPLYVQPSDTNANDFYRYPPLLAILFRPLALLPYPAAAAIWVAILVVATVLTFRRLGLREPVGARQAAGDGRFQHAGSPTGGRRW